jgi:hypothetical protein
MSEINLSSISFFVIYLLLNWFSVLVEMQQSYRILFPLISFPELNAGSSLSPQA